MNTGYKQPIKDKSRKLLWEHAIESLTLQRAKNEILNERYIRKLWNYCFKERLSKFTSIHSPNTKILDDWVLFAKQCYGAKTPTELKVAYLCGPEPENDLNVLLELGIRIENVWAFESDSQLYKNAIINIKDNFPTLKIFNGRIDTFLSISPAKFDIIYLDFTGPIFSSSSKPYQAIHGVFDNQSLSELGILIVNSSLPEKTDESIDFLSAYFFNQKLIESTVLSDNPELHHDGSYGEGADAYGMLNKNDVKSFIDKNFWFAYSAFATHYPIFYANLIQPAYHVLKNTIAKKRIFEIREAALNNITEKYFSREEIIEEWTDYAFYNFLQSLGSYRSATEWSKHFESNANGASRELAVQYLYMLRDAVHGDFLHLLSDSLKKSIPKISNSIPDINGGLFCDVPMIHLWLELAINQLGYPNHSNTKNHKRFSYKAKEREMFIDIFTFDRCRALYDWLPMIEYYGEDLSNVERQMITRICMDAIGKHRLYILDALYFGSSLVCINDKSWSKNHEFKKRTKLLVKPVKSYTYSNIAEMKVLAPSDEDSPTYKLVIKSFTPSSTDQDHYRTKVYFLSSRSINSVSNKAQISAQWKHSFAITQTFPLDGDQDNPVHLVILNEEECERLKLSEREKAAVILHELGHIFNRHPELDKILTLSQCLDQGKDYPSELAKQKKFLGEDEFYADYFAIKYGFKDELTSCLQKSMTCDSYKKLHSEFIKRVEFNAKNTNELNGNRKQFRRV